MDLEELWRGSIEMRGTPVYAMANTNDPADRPPTEKHNPSLTQKFAVAAGAILLLTAVFLVASDPEWSRLRDDPELVALLAKLQAMPR